MWFCERGHPHSFDLLRGAGYVEMGKAQSAPIAGICRPNLTVLNTHRDPTAFIEIVRTHRPGKSREVAQELGIPLFTILASDRNVLRPGLYTGHPWWEFDPGLSDKDREQMRFMRQVADEMMRRDGSGDSTWAELDLVFDGGGGLQFGSCRGSPPDLSSPMFPRNGDMIVAEICSWDCEISMEVTRREWELDRQAAEIMTRRELEERLGHIVLKAIRNASNGVGRLVVPIGTEEVHVDMSIHPLNPHVGPDGRVALDLVKQVGEASERVRETGKL